MKICRCFLLLLFVVLFASPLVAQPDVDGSADHPLISRYPGSRIGWYDVQEFDRYKIAVGPVTGYRHIEDWLPVEGKVTRIYYELSGTHSVTEVYLNYLNAIKKAGMEIVAEGLHSKANIAKTIGGRGWLLVHFSGNPLPPGQNVQLLNGSSTAGGSCFVAGKLTRNGATTYVVVSGTQFRDDMVLFMIDVIEVKAAEDDLIIIDPDAMLREIEMNGKVALYGIYFDTGKWDIRPESNETLEAVATLLKNNPKMKLYIVGHTDDTGGLQMNLDLSKNRAQSVVKTMVETYGIADNRLAAFGAGPHAPASTNRTADGRQLNRRVELVEQLPQ